MEHTCHNTPSDSTMGNYMIKVPMCNSGNPEEWIIFVELGQNITNRPQEYQFSTASPTGLRKKLV